MAAAVANFAEERWRAEEEGLGTAREERKALYLELLPRDNLREREKRGIRKRGFMKGGSAAAQLYFVDRCGISPPRKI